MTDKEQIMDKLYGALAGLFLVYGLSTEEGSGKIIIELLKEAEKQLARKTQECEALKEKLNIQTDLSIRCVPEKVLNRYRKALEEIENVWKRDEDGDYDFIKFKILDIISKAKGEE